MSEENRERVLVVANRTAATPTLMDAVRERAERSPCEFTLLVPKLSQDAFGDEEARRTVELALPLLQEAAGAPVEGQIGHCDPLRAIEQAREHSQYDEVIISTLPERVSRWLHRDLPARVERLGMQVTVIKATAPRRPLRAPIVFGGP